MRHTCKGNIFRAPRNPHSVDDKNWLTAGLIQISWRNAPKCYKKVTIYRERLSESESQASCQFQVSQMAEMIKDISHNGLDLCPAHLLTSFIYSLKSGPSPNHWRKCYAYLKTNPLRKSLQFINSAICSMPFRQDRWSIKEGCHFFNNKFTEVLLMFKMFQYWPVEHHADSCKRSCLCCKADVLRSPLTNIDIRVRTKETVLPPFQLYRK